MRRRLVFERIRPQLSRLSIAEGWKRVFGAQGQIEFLKSMFKLGAVTVLGFMLLRSAQHDVIERHDHGAVGAARA